MIIIIKFQKVIDKFLLIINLLMKHNRSLKEIIVPKCNFKEKEDHESAWSPRNFQPENCGFPASKVDHKLNKNTQSQKNLFNINPLNSSLASPKYVIQHNVNPVNVLTPANKNVMSQQQPKRPRILSKVKHSNSFSQQFKLGKVLGKGRFGNVFLAFHNQTGSVYAAKQISLEKVTPKLIQRLIAEIKIQFYLKHENCLELYKFYKENKNIYLILEIGESSLFDILRQKRFFTERETAYYIRQTINALIHLHENGVIHRDLKPENIVLVNNVVKLADFGWSIYTGKTNKRTTFCGTLDYVSPQIVMGNQYDEMVDVWSVGVLCYQLCTGHAPFESSKSRQETYRKILNVDLKFPKHLSEEVQSFIRRLLVRKPEGRMTLEEALQHPWLKKYQCKNQ